MNEWMIKTKKKYGERERYHFKYWIGGAIFTVSGIKRSEYEKNVTI